MSENNPLQLSQLAKEDTEKNNNQPAKSVKIFGLNPIIIISGLLIIATLIAVFVWYRRKKASLPSTPNKEESKPPTSQKPNEEEEEDEDDELQEQFQLMVNENRKLKQEVKDLQMTNKNYTAHINRLAEELENKSSKQLMPMNENSYDAPDPNKKQEKPQIIKDKDAIRQLVNSRRPTVQDEIDNRNHAKEEEQNKKDQQAIDELKATTQVLSDDDEASEEDNGLPEPPVNKQSATKDDKDVETLMNIIQQQ